MPHRFFNLSEIIVEHNEKAQENRGVVKIKPIYLKVNLALALKLL